MLDVCKQDDNHIRLIDNAQIHAIVSRNGPAMQIIVHRSLTVREALQLVEIITEVATHGGT